VRGTVRDPTDEKKVGFLKKLPGAAERLELVRRRRRRRRRRNSAVVVFMVVVGRVLMVVVMMTRCRGDGTRTVDVSHEFHC